MRDTSLEMRRAKAFHHLNSSYFESALIFCTVLFSVSPFSTPFTRTSYLLLSFRISFTRIPHLLLFPSYLVYPHPESALISSNLVYPYPASTLIFSHIVYPYPVSTLIPFAPSLLATRTCSNLFEYRSLSSLICF